ncbi:hypothetical protein [Propionivibrio soli]|uniref:hypothetical protein n=1 Tax=Propionivibrio soli TaxID=2976531 RepID=UPI0021E91719|nr:hypothetical protein [Propionivibrio soli]
MYGYQVGPAILGIILGTLLDTNCRRTMTSAGEEPVQFMPEFFTSRVSIVVLLSTLTILSQIRFWGAIIGALAGHVQHLAIWLYPPVVMVRRLSLGSLGCLRQNSGDGFHQG